MKKYTLEKSNLAKGIFWILAMTLISNGNDVLTKFLGQRLPAPEVAFFRFFFGLVTIIPVMLYSGRQSWIPQNIPFHTVRTVLGFVAIMLWCFGIGKVHLALGTIMGFTVPLFILPLAMVFLREHIGAQRWSVTLLGFIGIVFATGADGGELNIGAFILLISAFIFAVSDILGKKMLTTEPLPTILFYFSLGATILALAPALYYWESPTTIELLLLFFLGIGCNLIQYCVLKAFVISDASVLSPFRYAEFFISIATAWIFFGEELTMNIAIGAAIVIPCTLYLAHYEMRNKKKVLA